MTVTQTKEATEFICNLDAIAEENREAHIALAQHLVLESYIEIKRIRRRVCFQICCRRIRHHP